MVGRRAGGSQTEAEEVLRPLGMRILLLCVGRARNAPEQELCDAYLKRARDTGKKPGFPEIAFATVDTSRATDVASRMAEEAKRLSKQVPQGAYRIALDERGQSFASTEFAGRLATLRDSGIRDVVFVVGGPDGLDQGFRNAADAQLALGPQTWPHLLVRTMLAEQIYRALAILAGHPYHREG